MVFGRAGRNESTKIKPDVLEELLGKDLWLPAQKCLEYGLVDEII
jgi:ATP-dependent protease ClpP protease subunit